MEQFTLDYRDLLAIQKTMNYLEAEFKQRGFKEAMDIIRTRFIENKDPRAMNMDEYYKGFDEGINQCFAIIRDNLLWKTQ